MILNSLSFRRLVAGMALLLLAPLSLLAQPSARTTPGMVFDEVSRRAILFGGATPAFVRGEEQFARDYINETWAWNGRRWVQLFPAASPPPRGGFAFVWDSFADRALLFGGVGSGLMPVGGTWEYRNGVWTELDVPNEPEARKYPSAAFDRVRNKVVLFGGYRTEVTIDPKTGKELRIDHALRDTWEFDGTTWTKIGDDGPDVTSSVMVYDGTRDETLLLGMKLDSTTVMYRYAAGAWEAVTPAKLPTCLSRTAAVWQEHSGNVLLYGGACNTGEVTATSWEWDGTNWTAVEGSLSAGRIFGHAMAYDAARGETLLFGGTAADLGAETNFTFRYRNSRWQSAWSNFTPAARSLFGFTTDPVNNAVWLFGGIRGWTDLWKYAYGQWSLVSATDAPETCAYPLTSWDSDRKVMVLVCSDASVFEFDGSRWKRFTTSDKRPLTSIQAGMAYDPNLKKTVLYGGYNGNYIDDTWTWDGSTWTEVKGETAHYRAVQAMFYDPISKKVVIYGGLGRTSRDGTLVRFADTWTFNGKDWVEATSVGAPPVKYGAAVAYNPQDNKVHLFGGWNERAEFVAEHWVWDGAKWSAIVGGRVPPARANARLAWDPTMQRFVLYGGYAGYYLADLWVLEGSSWRPVEEVSGRTRLVTLPPPGAPASDADAVPSGRGRSATRQ